MGFRRMLTVATTAIAFASCTFAESGRLSDSSGVVENFSIEEVAEDDSRILALDLPMPFDGSVMSGGRVTQVAFSDEDCGPLPNVSVAVAGGQLAVKVFNAEGIEPCDGDSKRIVLITLELRQNFSSSSLEIE